MANQGFATAATIPSWGSGSDFVARLLTHNGFKSWRLIGNGVVNDATRFPSTTIYYTSKVKGPRSVRCIMTAHMATPIDGYNGLVTYSSGFAPSTSVNAWTMNLTRPATDITPFGEHWSQFSIGHVNSSGTYSGWPDDATALKAPCITAEPASASFQVLSGGTGKTITANIITSSMEADYTANQQTTMSYGFEVNGALVTSGTSSAALWTADSDGSLVSSLAAKTLTLTANGSLSYSGSAFWTRIGINVRVGQPMMIEVEAVFTGAVTGLALA